MPPAETVLVTGGAGFIGSHLVEALLTGGRQVVVFDNFNDFYDPDLKLANVAALRRHARIADVDLRILKGDLRSVADVERALATLGDPDRSAVVHLAAMAGVRPSIRQPRLYQTVNVDGTLNLLEACRGAGVRRLLFASSSSVYGNNAKVPFAEDDPVDAPISPYAMTKKAGELLCHNYHHLYRMSVACLRFFTVYGPRQRPDLAIRKFTSLIATDSPLPFYGDGSTRRDYTYVDDTVQGVLGALAWLEGAAEPRYRIFNLGESQTVTLARLVDLLGRALGRTPRLERLPQQPGDVLCTFADIARARAELGYAPQVGIEEGLDRFVAWFREAGGEKK